MNRSCGACFHGAPRCKCLSGCSAGISMQTDGYPPAAAGDHLRLYPVVNYCSSISIPMYTPHQPSCADTPRLSRIRHARTVGARVHNHRCIECLRSGIEDNATSQLCKKVWPASLQAKRHQIQCLLPEPAHSSLQSGAHFTPLTHTSMAWDITMGAKRPHGE